MRQILAASVILFLAGGLLGLGFSTCPSFMLKTPQIRMANSCGDDDCCLKMCLQGQDDFPALLQTASLNFQDTFGWMEAASMSVQSDSADQQRQPASLRVAVAGPWGAVYLLNSTFLI